MELVLPYGRVPLRVAVGDRLIETIQAVALPAPPPVGTLLEAALDAPIGAPRLESLGRPGSRVTIIVSDPTRAEPRENLVTAVRRRLPGVRWTLAIATGTHGPCRDLGRLGLPDAFVRDATVIDHDGHAPEDLVTLGTTSRGTPVRLHRCLVETDLVVATGCIRPHYFAGFGAGIKAIFPGLGEATAIRINHRLKTEPRARAGIVDGNPCRDDLEEAVRLLATPTFLVNGVGGPDGLVHDAVAGDRTVAFRAGADRARPWFTVRATPAPLVIASDVLPISASLYQASKIAAAAAPLVAPGGTLAIAAECPDGLGGPLDTVNEAILRIGVLPRLPPRARLVLISAMSRELVAKTLVELAPSVESVLADHPGRVLVIPRASQLLCEASS